MKKRVCVLLVALCLSLIGCGQNGSESAGTVINASDLEDMTAAEMKDYLEQYGYTIDDFMNGNVPLAGSWSSIPSDEEDRIVIKTSNGYLVIRDGEWMEVDEDDIDSNPR